MGIVVDDIDKVLIGDEWLSVGRGSFSIEAYVFEMEDGGEYSYNDSPAFCFKDRIDGSIVQGPLASIKAFQLW